MDRIYHPYWAWEDHENGFYDSCSGQEKDGKLDLVVNMFSSDILTKEWMLYVVDNWKYSCEHNLSNDQMNKVAWLGQAACCAFGGIPNTVTMEAWSLVDKEHRDKADEIANECINYWENKNKRIQLCLNLD